jgi:hypothetical protein
MNRTADIKEKIDNSSKSIPTIVNSESVRKGSRERVSKVR